MLVLVVMDVVFRQRILKKLEPGSVIQGSLQWKIIIEDQCTFQSLTGICILYLNLFIHSTLSGEA